MIWIVTIAILSVFSLVNLVSIIAEPEEPTYNEAKIDTELKNTCEDAKKVLKNILKAFPDFHIPESLIDRCNLKVIEQQAS